MCVSEWADGHRLIRHFGYEPLILLVALVMWYLNLIHLLVQTTHVFLLTFGIYELETLKVCYSKTSRTSSAIIVTMEEVRVINKNKTRPTTGSFFMFPAVAANTT